MTGIYKIVNDANGKIYIGQSRDIDTRWYKHISFLRYNSHHNRHLQAAWNKYGEDAFKFSVVEECGEDDLNDRERYYINLYDSRRNGYNLDDGGSGVSGYKHSAEQLMKMRLVHNSAVLLQFDTHHELIRRWIGGIGEAQKALKFTSECVRLRCTHEIKKMSPYRECYWVFEEEYLHPSFTWEKYMENQRICCVDRGQRNSSRKIRQYDLSLNLIKEWDSLSAIRKAGYNSHQVCAICRQYKGKKTHRGYVWTYADYDFSDGYFNDRIPVKTLKKYNRL